MKSPCSKGSHCGTAVVCTTLLTVNYNDKINISRFLLNSCSFRCLWWYSTLTCRSERAACAAAAGALIEACCCIADSQL